LDIVKDKIIYWINNILDKNLNYHKQLFDLLDYLSKYEKSYYYKLIKDCDIKKLFDRYNKIYMIDDLINNYKEK
jgi:hypothetical protein